MSDTESVPIISLNETFFNIYNNCGTDILEMVAK